jgi:tetratricopeptide (TPR) repeat protein
MQQQPEIPPPPVRGAKVSTTSLPSQKALALAVLMVGLVILVAGGRVLWHFLAPDYSTSGQRSLTAARRALADDKPERAVQLAHKASGLLEQTFDTGATLQAYSFEALALHRAGQQAETAAALSRALDFASRAGGDPVAYATLAELFFDLRRYELVTQYAREAGTMQVAQGNNRLAGQMLTRFAGRLAEVQQPEAAVQLYAEAVQAYALIGLKFETAQLFERMGIVLAPTAPERAYAAYVKALNEFSLMGEEQRARAVIAHVQQLPPEFLETIDE